MKKLAILVVVLSLATVACDAFKDSYDQVNDPTVATGSENTNAGGAVGDATVCQAVEGVTVTAAEEAGTITSTVLSTAADGSLVKAVAEKVTDTSTKITISEAEKAVIAFVIMKAEDGAFSVCSVVSEGFTLKSGTLTIDSFNLADEADASKIINAGSFSFVLTEDIEYKTADEKASNTAIDVMSKMTTSKSDSSEITMEGTYFVNTLAEAAAE